MSRRIAERAPRWALAAVISVVVLAALVGAAGCGGSQQDDQQSGTTLNRQTSDEPLRVAVQYNALSIPTVFADEYGYFDEEGLNVEISTFVNGAEENQAIEKGAVDVASDGLASVYMLATGNFSWIGESDKGSATVAVYVKEGSAPAQVSGELADSPNVKGSADTLRGLTVVGPAGTMEEWTAVAYFSQFGLSVGTDYDFIEMDREQAVDAALSGAADVFIATDVDYARLMEDNGFVALAQGEEATEVPFNNGYLVSNRVLETRYDDLVAFLVAVYRAAETLDNDPDLWHRFAFEYYDMNGKPATWEDVQRELQLRHLLVPADFEQPDYRLGHGVLDVGSFDARIGALEDDQVAAIEKSINPRVLEDAFGITVEAAKLN